MQDAKLSVASIERSTILPDSPHYLLNLAAATCHRAQNAAICIQPPPNRHDTITLVFR
jgi:hypothetical protein